MNLADNIIQEASNLTKEKKESHIDATKVGPSLFMLIEFMKTKATTCCSQTESSARSTADFLQIMLGKLQP
jgi:hypothetical protein